ncbi:hypothetical protein [Streptomyces roseoverticillatus]|uniref:Uncharacterized protein n=1 Tax=Streptomyces roseoverticillatus TaxID=66429 RepID=A0ABV3IMC9_9ACTN
MKRIAGLACAAAAALACGVATADAHGEQGAYSEHEKAQGFVSTPHAAPQQAAVPGTETGGFLQVFGDPVEVGPGANAPAVAVCPIGHVPVGGGGETSAHRIYLTDSFAQGPQWVTRGTNTSNGSESMRAFVVCAARG